MSKYLEDYAKMQVLRKVAKKMPNGTLEDILKRIDNTWDEKVEKLIPPKKGFVTKF